MVKKILITIAVLILIVIIGFICKDIVVTNTYADNDRFIKINDMQIIDGYPLRIVYDKETKVQYAFAGRTCFTPLIDTEGNPLLYEEGE